MLNKLLEILPAFWLFAVGSNVFALFPELGFLTTPVVLGGAAFLLVRHYRRVPILLGSIDFLLALSLVAAPVALTLIFRFTPLGEDREIVGRSGAFYAAVALVFLVASVIAFPFGSRRRMVQAAFWIVGLGTVLNLWELFIQPNRWSGAAGRSAGLYGNPNHSAEALIGYGLIFLLYRSGKLTWRDFCLIALLSMGVFATFSRGGILGGIVLVTVAVVYRSEPRHLVRVAFAAAAGAFLIVSFVWFVLQNVELSGDAALRVVSLIERGGVGDYQDDRGTLAIEFWELGMENPIFGLGLGTMFDMPIGPHNMFVALFVDLGLLGLAAYVIVLIRLTISALRADHELAGPLWLLVAWHVFFSFASHNILSNLMTIPLLALAATRGRQVSLLNRWVASFDGFPRKSTACAHDQPAIQATPRGV